MHAPDETPQDLGVMAHAPRGWEWPGLSESITVVVLLLMALCGAVAMVVQMLRPKVRVRVVAAAVARVARDAGEAAGAVLGGPAAELRHKNG